MTFNPSSIKYRLSLLQARRGPHSRHGTSNLILCYLSSATLPEMLFRSRRQARSWTRRALAILIAAFIIDYLLVTFSNPLEHRETLESYPAINRNTKIFIASVHRNNEYILRLHWNEAVLKLVQYLGPQNVFFSSFESGSQDNTKDALRDLDTELISLGVRTNVVLDKTVLEQIAEVQGEPGEEGWIWTTNGKKELRRIPYLANLRNKVMENLNDESAKGNNYDLVLWLNDVVFTVSSTVNDFEVTC